MKVNLCIHTNKNHFTIARIVENPHIQLHDLKWGQGPSQKLGSGLSVSEPLAKDTVRSRSSHFEEPLSLLGLVLASQIDVVPPGLPIDSIVTTSLHTQFEPMLKWLGAVFVHLLRHSNCTSTCIHSLVHSGNLHLTFTVWILPILCIQLWKGNGGYKQHRVSLPCAAYSLV